jgi:predicted nucleic-acid-binding protein
VIGLDSNILLRAITNDDTRQSPIAQRVISGLTAQSPGGINIIVLVEVAWTLRRRYRRTHADVWFVIETLLASPAYLIGERQAVIRALEISQAFGLEFSDAVIAALNDASAWRPTLTFDDDARRSPLFVKQN